MSIDLTDDVVLRAERRCLAVRCGGYGPYGGLVRAAAAELFTTMFPRFVNHRGSGALIEDVDAFFLLHGASRGAFVQMGTEFVAFMQQRLGSSVSRMVLEYEWTLFDVEVHPAVVRRAHEVVGKDGLMLGLNPTLRFIAVPSTLVGDDPISVEALALPPSTYGVYRTADHQVLTKPLGPSDIAGLRPFEAGPARVYGPLDTWLVEALNGDLLTVFT